MPRIFLGIFCIVLGLGSCVGGLVYGMGDLFQSFADPMIVTNDSSDRVTIEKPGRYELMLATTLTHQGDDLGTKMRDLPDGDFGFRDAAGQPVQLSPSANVPEMEAPNGTFESLGSAKLEPGTYTVLAPETEANLTFWVMPSLQEASESTVLWAGIGAGVMVVFLVAGILLIVSGARANRGKRQADYA